MVSGRKAFSGESPVTILTRVLNEEPAPLGAGAVSIPVDLEKIILRCLRKDPNRRFQTMADLKVAIEDVAQETVLRQPSKTGRQRWIWPAAALIALGVLAGFLFRWLSSRAPVSVELLRAVPLTALPGVERHPTFSPDGDHVAFSWDGLKQDNPDIYVQQVGVGTQLRLTSDPGNDYSPAWSPDGRWIAFLRAQSASGPNQLVLIPPLGGPERKLAELRTPVAPWLRAVSIGWCPDSSCIVATDSTGDGKPMALFVISLESGEKRQLTLSPNSVMGDSDPAISPDGRWLVFRRNIAPFIGELYRLQLQKGVAGGGEPTRLTAAAWDAVYPAWMPGSEEILFAAKGGLWRLAVSGTSDPVRLPFVGEDGMMPVVSPHQPGRPVRLAYVRSSVDINIWRIDTSAPGAAAIAPPAVAIASTRQDHTPSFSPDGHRVAFVSNRSGDSEVWVSDPDGSNAASLTSGAGLPGYPRWSPDGKLIAFHSNPEGRPQVYLVPAAGGKTRNLSSNPAAEGFPNFSRDSRWIYMFSNRNGGDFAIWKIDAGGGSHDIQLIKSNGGMSIESPDGSYVYYVENDNSPIWRVPASGGVAEKVIESVYLGNYAVLDGGIYYIDRVSNEARLQYFDFATHKSTIAARNLGNVNRGLTASSDGRIILYTRIDSSVDDLMLVENFR